MARRSFATLAEYLDGTGTTQAELAARVGVSQAQMSHIVRRFVEPKLSVALRLHAETDVPLEAFVLEQPEQVA